MAAVEDQNLTADDMYNSMQVAWRGVCDAIREEIEGSAFDGRQIGSMARKLADGRRARKLSIKDVELIQSLYSQFKRFARMQGSKEEWLDEDVFRSFLLGADEAKRALAAM